MPGLLREEKPLYFEEATGLSPHMPTGAGGPWTGPDPEVRVRGIECKVGSEIVFHYETQ